MNVHVRLTALHDLVHVCAYRVPALVARACSTSVHERVYARLTSVHVRVYHVPENVA
jgi:hypothetical protein